MNENSKCCKYYSGGLYILANVLGEAKIPVTGRLSPMSGLARPSFVGDDQGITVFPISMYDARLMHSLNRVFEARFELNCSCLLL